MLVITGRLLDKSGVSTFKVLFWLVLLFVAGYACYKFVPPFFGYQMMKYEVGSTAKVAHLYSNEEITLRIIDKAKGWKVPIEWNDIVVERRTRRIDIKIEYDVTVDLYQDYEKTWLFRINAREPLKKR